jgi:CRP/FNR family transcriptional regulator, cyclic AMP receptor protein
MIARNGPHLFLYDLDSTLGTIVNGRAIGRHFPADTAVLDRGENRVIAGGWESPFDFSVVVG